MYFFILNSRVNSQVKPHVNVKLDGPLHSASSLRQLLTCTCWNSSHLFLIQICGAAGTEPLEKPNDFVTIVRQERDVCNTLGKVAQTVSPAARNSA